jgi:hypothetical protein
LFTIPPYFPGRQVFNPGVPDLRFHRVKEHTRVSDGFSGGVVVVVEVSSALAGAAAAMAIGEDVAALVLFGSLM